MKTYNPDTATPGNSSLDRVARPEPASWSSLRRQFGNAVLKGGKSHTEWPSGASLRRHCRPAAQGVRESFTGRSGEGLCTARRGSGTQRGKRDHGATGQPSGVQAGRYGRNALPSTHAGRLDGDQPGERIDPAGERESRRRASGSGRRRRSVLEPPVRAMHASTRPGSGSLGSRAEARSENNIGNRSHTVAGALGFAFSAGGDPPGTPCE